MDTNTADVLRQLNEENAAVVQKVREANADVRDRLGALEFSAVYDVEEDTLLVTFGEPQEAISEAATDNVFLRLDPETYKIVGIEVLGFRGRFADYPPVADIFFTALRTNRLRVEYGETIATDNSRGDIAGSMGELLAV